MDFVACSRPSTTLSWSTARTLSKAGLTGHGYSKQMKILQWKMKIIQLKWRFSNQINVFQSKQMISNQNKWCLGRPAGLGCETTCFFNEVRLKNLHLYINIAMEESSSVNKLCVLQRSLHPAAAHAALLLPGAVDAAVAASAAYNLRHRPLRLQSPDTAFDVALAHCSGEMAYQYLPRGTFAYNWDP